MSRSVGILALALVVGAAFALRQFGGPEAVLEALRGLGPWGAAVAFVALHAISVPCLVPSIVPTLAAGALFGFALGLPLTLLGAALGAVAAFGIGRTLAHDLVERRLGGEPRFRALSEAVNRKGWRIVALARLTPVFPFSVGNYGFGLTRMRAWDYFFASMLGTLPSNAVYVYLGAATGGLLAGSDRARTPAEWALLALGLAATVVLTVMLRRMADRALAEARLQPAPSRSR